MTDDIRPQRTNRRDYTREIINIQPGHQSQTAKNGDSTPRPKINARNKQKPWISRKKNLVILLVIGVCAVGISLFFFRDKPSAPPFPTNLTSSLSYPIYLPTDTTSGYGYATGSAKIQAGILFYTLANRSKKIFVTEQNVPPNKINLSSLPKHTNLDVPIGEAVIGTGLGNPSVVIITSTTLIQLTSNKGVTKTDIISVAQKMSQQ